MTSWVKFNRILINMKHELTWEFIDNGWEAASSAGSEPGDWFTWRFIEFESKWVDNSSEELRIDDVIVARFNSPEEAKWQYQAWETEMLQEMGVEYHEEFNQ